MLICALVWSKIACSDREHLFKRLAADLRLLAEIVSCFDDQPIEILRRLAEFRSELLAGTPHVRSNGLHRFQYGLKAARKFAQFRACAALKRVGELFEEFLHARMAVVIELIDRRADLLRERRERACKRRVDRRRHFFAEAREELLAVDLIQLSELRSEAVADLDG